ncbi:MAG: acyltransferase [Geminicoccaceae bacterium]
MTVSSSRYRFLQVDGLRGIAALAVVAFHFEGEIFGQDTLSTKSEQHLYLLLLSAELFFTVSGFVIFMSLERKANLVDFWTSRILRIFPTYWLSVAAVGALKLLTATAPFGLVLVNATMVQRAFGYPDLVTAYWTLFWELIFYGLVSTSFFLFRGSNKDMDFFLLLFMLLMYAVQVVKMTALGGVDHYKSAYLTHFLHFFVLGICLYKIATRRAVALTYIAAILALGFSSFGRDDWAPVSGLVYFIGTGVIGSLVMLASHGRLPWLESPPLLFFGRLSFALYLFHQLATEICRLVGERCEASPYVVTLAAGALSLLLALAVDRWIEPPVRRGMAKVLERIERPAKGWVATLTRTVAPAPAVGLTTVAATAAGKALRSRLRGRPPGPLDVRLPNVRLSNERGPT